MDTNLADITQLASELMQCFTMFEVFLTLA
uniref:Uncharacterized protein n=1 Tax=Anguilla anguilla TaxID=7936 RepID=A0A0E9R5H6_ANGAN